MTAQVAADLRAAAEVLRTDGWVQSSYGFRDAPCCAVGALRRAVVGGSGSPFSLSGDNFMRVHLAAHGLRAVGYADPDGDPVMGVEAWNDAPGRTADEVIAALLAAADAAEASDV